MRLKFCCKRDVGRDAWGDPLCDRQDLVFLGSSEPGDTFSWVEFVLTVTTNGAFFVPVMMLLRRKRCTDALTGAALALTSTAYHACETTGTKFLSMNAGNWHRLDNLFSIAGAQVLGQLVAGPTLKGSFYRSFFFFLGVVLQELQPWKIATILFPILAAHGAAFIYVYCYDDNHWRRIRTFSFFRACLVQIAAFALFLRGLDHESDSLRAFHGAFHVTTALSASLFIKALDPLHSSGKEKKYN